ncbi:response regulator [Ilumatobacter sp.]|uniref:response regulator n=1 Tax=Ilumatobacter sp. TaxID=1967498 RepID=UPI003B5166F5
MHILLATDADWIVDEVTNALGGPEVTFTVCRDGRVVADQVAERTPDLAIFDLQIGSMGGMAVTMTLRLDESADALPHVPVLMLIDRRADLHLARRCGAEGWLIKPLDSLRLRRAAKAVAGGGRHTEGLAPDAPAVDPMIDTGGSGAAGDEATSSEEDAVGAG